MFGGVGKILEGTGNIVEGTLTLNPKKIGRGVDNVGGGALQASTLGAYRHRNNDSDSERRQHEQRVAICWRDAAEQNARQQALEQREQQLERRELALARLNAQRRRQMESKKKAEQQRKLVLLKKREAVVEKAERRALKVTQGAYTTTLSWGWQGLFSAPPAPSAPPAGNMPNATTVEGEEAAVFHLPKRLFSDSEVLAEPGAVAPAVIEGQSPEGVPNHQPGMLSSQGMFAQKHFERREGEPKQGPKVQCCGCRVS